MMKVLVTGVGGQLGYDVMNEIARRGYIGIGTDIVDRNNLYVFDKESAIVTMPYITLDITDKNAVNSVLEQEKPDVVVHCAAWTAVDVAEEEVNQQKVYAVNVQGTKNLANACKKIDCKMIYISTDYVFNGQGEKPWKEECREYQPLNVYGKTKLEGEITVSEILQKYFIVRISWVFGVNGNNFVKTMLKLGKKYEALRVVKDQIGLPTYTFDLAKLLMDMAETEKYGYYHATNEGEYISWYDFACAIFKIAGYNTKVIPVTTEEYGVSKAKRPLNSRLSTGKLKEQGFENLSNWKKALEDFYYKLKL